jgi:hypothetical protein
LETKEKPLVGAKVALSTHCDYYNMTTIYNGMKFSFNCYSYKVDSIIPKFNLEKNIENPHISLTSANGEVYKVYYEETTEKNMTEITVPSKRHNRDRWTTAVKDQLIYFPNVKYFIQREGSTDLSEIPFKATIFYNSDSILISDANRFNRPHIVVVKDASAQVGVCYGLVDFGELDMQQLYGSVGFKCPLRSVVKDEITGVTTVIQDGISVVPSRETIIWDEHTRTFIASLIEKAKDEATGILQKELKQTDLFEWLIKASQILSSMGYSYESTPTARTLNALSKIIDKSKLTPVFHNTNIKFSNSPSEFFLGTFTARDIAPTQQRDNKTNVIKTVVERKDAHSWGSLKDRFIFLDETETHDPVKDRYVCALWNQRSFLALKASSDEQLEQEALHQIKASLKDKDKEEIPKKALEARLKILKAAQNEFLEHIKKSSKSKLVPYSSIVVPEDFKKNLEAEEQSIEKQVEASKYITPAERRKLEEKVVIHRLFLETNYNYPYYPTVKSVKVEIKVEDLKNIKETVYYATTENRAVLHKLFRLQHFTKKANISSFNLTSENTVTTKQPLILIAERLLPKIKNLPNYKKAEERLKELTDQLESNKMQNIDNIIKTAVNKYTTYLVLSNLDPHTAVSKVKSSSSASNIFSKSDNEKLYKLWGYFTNYMSDISYNADSDSYSGKALEEIFNIVKKISKYHASKIMNTSTTLTEEEAFMADEKYIDKDLVSSLTEFYEIMLPLKDFILTFSLVATQYRIEPSTINLLADYLVKSNISDKLLSEETTKLIEDQTQTPVNDQN